MVPVHGSRLLDTVPVPETEKSADVARGKSRDIFSLFSRPWAVNSLGGIRDRLDDLHNPNIDNALTYYCSLYVEY